MDMSTYSEVKSHLQKISWEPNLSIVHIMQLLSKASTILKKNGIDWNEKTKRAVVRFFKQRITDVKVYNKTVDQILALVQKQEEEQEKDLLDAHKKLKEEVRTLGGEEYYELIIFS